MNGLIEKVEMYDSGGAAITYDQGWTIVVSGDELGDCVPQIGDFIEVGPNVGFPIQYIKINDRVVRNISDEEQAQMHDKFVSDLRKRREDEFIKNGAEWKARVQTLLPVLRARMERFESEDGDEFWIESGSYELYAIGAADVLARHAMNLYPDDVQFQLDWIDWWNSLNSATYNYDYQRQRDILPEFGDGHSGNTHGAAVYYAKRAVQGIQC